MATRKSRATALYEQAAKVGSPIIGRRITIWIATTASNNARGSWSRKVRMSCPGFCRTTACRVEARSIGRMTTPASAVIWP